MSTYEPQTGDEAALPVEGDEKPTSGRARPGSAVQR